MKTIRILSIFAAAALSAATAVNAEKLVIIHTNDTHSQIDPTDDNDTGGILRRKALVDSVRRANDNVLLIDAGDAVQGTLYFNLYGGEVEQKLMNALGYDIRILGNHEFDNGADALYGMLKGSEADNLATNYDLSASPLDSIFKPYTVKEFGGKRIAFIGINLDPKGMISEGNYDGVRYLDAVKAANSTAWHLKHNEKVDAVIAVTHIGYKPATPPGDAELAALSEDIDIIIGGHSHDLITPGGDNSRLRDSVPNALGRPVLVTQAGKSGRNVGQITIDLDDMSADYRILPVDSRYDNRLDPDVAAIIEPYRHGVDSLLALKVGRSAIELDNRKAPLLNFVSDFTFDCGSILADSVDFAIINKGGLRRSLPKGNITEGMIKMMLPFNNRITVIDIKGRDLLPAFNQMARTDGNGVSRQVDIEYDADTDSCLSVTIGGQPLDPDHTYRVATIDYLSNGGDYMESLTRGRLVAESKQVLHNDLLDYFRHGKIKGKTIRPENRDRMHPRR